MRPGGLEYSSSAKGKVYREKGTMDESLVTEQMDEGRKRRGRPSIDPLERFKRMRVRQERWKRDNREAYLEQKRQLSRRPEYVAYRRQMYARKQADALERANPTVSQTTL